jgi:hypothetical protein
MGRDEEPFFVKKWSDVKSGNEYIKKYRLFLTSGKVF